MQCCIHDAAYFTSCLLYVCLGSFINKVCVDSMQNADLNKRNSQPSSRSARPASSPARALAPAWVGLPSSVAQSQQRSWPTSVA